MKAKFFDPRHAMINCLEPQIIINPNLPDYLRRYGNYCLNGEFNYIKLDYLKSLLLPISSVFSPNKNGINVQNMENSYVFDASSGECFPIYLLVPCGHCMMCTDSKVYSFVCRCQYESQLYNCDPVHMTLTYDNDHLPDDKSVDVRVHQLFMKRFRQDLVRSGYKFPIRFACAAEYGKKEGHRPHYHYIVWNLCPNKNFSWRDLHSIALKAWHEQCHGERLFMMPINADYIPKGAHKTLRDMGKSNMDAFAYVAKYFYKEGVTDTPPGRKKIFHTSSRGKRGGIGAPFIDKFKFLAHKRVPYKTHFIDKFSGKVLDFNFDRYFLNRVFPSRLTAIPYVLRRAVRTLGQYYCYLDDTEKLYFNQLKDKYSKYFFVGYIKHLNSGFCFDKLGYCCFSSEVCFRSKIIDAFKVAHRYDDVSFDHVLEVDAKRHLLLSYMFRNKEPIDLIIKRSIKNQKRAKQRTLL